MLTRIGRQMLRRFSTRYDYDVSYMEQMLTTAPGAFIRFGVLSAISAYHKAAPIEALFAVKLLAAASEDCGPCTQLVVGMASEAGMPLNQIRTVLSGQTASMTAPTRLGYMFGRAMAYGDTDLDEARCAIEAAWGNAAVIELSMGFAIARVFPTTKRGMNYAAACTVVTVGDQPTKVVRLASYRSSSSA